MRRMLALLVAALCLCPGARAEGAEKDYLGAWYANEVFDGEQRFPAALHGLDGYAFEFFADGSCGGLYDGLEFSGSWALNADGSARILGADEALRASIADGRLLLDLFGDGSLYICMDREADTPALLPEPRDAVAVEAFAGAWTCSEYVMNGLRVPFSAGEAPRRLTLETDGSARLSDGNADAPGVWRLRGGGLFLEIGEETFSGALHADLLVLEGEDFGYVFAREP